MPLSYFEKKNRVKNFSLIIIGVPDNFKDFIMAILHYTLGLPPKRNGGSLVYAESLISEQAKTIDVIVLTCGETLFRSRKSKIKKSNDINGISHYTLTNPLTPTLIYGVSSPELQYRDVDIDYKNISKFVVDNNIQIMHLHTLMGLHKEIVKFIKSLGVKIIYTTHDFYGICPHYNLIDYKGELCQKQEAFKCARCNCNEPSDLFLRVINSALYQNLKKSRMIRCLKEKSKAALGTSRIEILKNITEESVNNYAQLLRYYQDFFRLIDKFHFNSSQTQKVFKDFFLYANGQIIPITTREIADKRKPLSKDKVIKFGFIGSLNEYKGFPMLKQTVLELEKEGFDNFQVLVYGGSKVGVDEDTELIHYQPPYNYTQLSDIMYHLDGTIVPSKCYETFSLVTLESLAHGRPAIVSDNVGAKDIVAKYNSNFIFSGQNGLKSILKSILQSPNILSEENEKILSLPWSHSMESHCQEILSFYKN